MHHFIHCPEIPKKSGEKSKKRILNALECTALIINIFYTSTIFIFLEMVVFWDKKIFTEKSAKKKFGCRRWIWTTDLRVMSPTSYQAAPFCDIRSNFYCVLDYTIWKKFCQHLFYFFLKFFITKLNSKFLVKIL